MLALGVIGVFFTVKCYKYIKQKANDRNKKYYDEVYVKSFQKFQEAEKDAKNSYAEALKQYEESVELYRMQKMQQSKILSEQTKQMQDFIQKTEALLTEYYRKNIIPEKYQHDLVAVCMFYDYLKNGRTRSITITSGDPGAVNLFEEDKKHQQIMTQMGAIMNNLDSIRHNQGVLYRALEEGRREQAQLLSSMNESMIAVQTQTAYSNYLLEINNKQNQYRNDLLDDIFR